MTDPETRVRERLDFRRVLVALDGSPEGERAFSWIRLLAPKSRVIALHVQVPVHSLGPDGLIAVSPFPMDAGSYGKKIRRRVRPAPEVVVRSGYPPGEILDLSSRRSVDLIALTNHGGGTLYRRILGGVTEELLHRADRPVLVVPACAPRPSSRTRIRRIVVPLDGSETVERVLPSVRELARSLDAEVSLLHCATKKDLDTGLMSKLWGRIPRIPALRRRRRALLQERRRMDDHLQDLAGQFRRSGVEARSVIAEGRGASAILRAMKETGANLVVLGVHGHGALRHVLHGALASRLIRLATVPVLALRHDLFPVPAVRETDRPKD